MLGALARCTICCVSARIRRMCANNTTLQLFPSTAPLTLSWWPHIKGRVDKYREALNPPYLTALEESNRRLEQSERFSWSD